MTDKLTTTKPLDVLTADQAERVDRIKAYHAASLKAFGDQMGYAFLTGFELNAVKAEIAHGQFMKWREKFLPELNYRTASRYMEFAAKLDTVSNLPTVSSRNFLGNGEGKTLELSEKDREKILKAVHKVADGKTLTQLYRDLGVIRGKEAPAHHPQKDLSPEEKLAAENEQAAARRAALITELNLMSDDLESKTSFLATRTSPAQAKEIQSALRRLGKLINPLTQRKSVRK